MALFSAIFFQNNIFLKYSCAKLSDRSRNMFQMIICSQGKGNSIKLTDKHKGQTPKSESYFVNFPWFPARNKKLPCSFIVTPCWEFLAYMFLTEITLHNSLLAKKEKKILLFFLYISLLVSNMRRECPSYTFWSVFVSGKF